jgi:hypothetical protein
MCKDRGEQAILQGEGPLHRGVRLCMGSGNGIRVDKSYQGKEYNNKNRNLPHISSQNMSILSKKLQRVYRIPILEH